MINPPEPDIVVNGVTLSEAQAMTVRVALSHFHMWLGDKENSDALGPLADNYRRLASEVFDVMVKR